MVLFCMVLSQQQNDQSEFMYFADQSVRSSMDNVYSDRNNPRNQQVALPHSYALIARVVHSNHEQPWHMSLLVSVS